MCATRSCIFPHTQACGVPQFLFTDYECDIITRMDSPTHEGAPHPRHEGPSPAPERNRPPLGWLPAFTTLHESSHNACLWHDAMTRSQALARHAQPHDAERRGPTASGTPSRYQSAINSVPNSQADLAAR